MNKVQRKKNAPEYDLDQIVGTNSATMVPRIITFPSSTSEGKSHDLMPENTGSTKFENSAFLQDEANVGNNYTSHKKQENEIVAQSKKSEIIPNSSAADEKPKRVRKSTAKKTLPLEQPAKIPQEVIPINEPVASPVQMSGLELLVNASKGLLETYYNSALHAMRPVRFIATHLFTITLGMAHLLMPVLMTYLISQLPFVSSRLSQVNSLTTYGYLAMFYVLSTIVWITGYLMALSAARALKTQVYKMAEIGQQM